MHFGLSEEQQMIVDTTRSFVENELFPHEAEVERTGILRRELLKEISTVSVKNPEAKVAKKEIPQLIDDSDVPPLE